MGTTHVVRQGECLSQIAQKYGFADYKAVYGHPDNADFRKKRPKPDLIYPGDELQIPDPDKKVVDCGTGQQHKFQVKVPKRKLKIVLQDSEANPLDGVAYRLVVGDETFHGTTGGDGVIAHDLPVTATAGELTLNGQAFPVRVGHLNPLLDVDDGGLSGAHARLVNLGFASGPPGEATDFAIRSYRRAHGLDPDAGLDDALARKLEKEHGC